ncbi:MAG: ribonuclease III [Hyphomonadaceae bacterium]
MAQKARLPDALAALEERIGWRFAAADLLVEALTHSSALDGAEGLRSNQRLEFLGDRVLNFVVAERIFKAAPDLNESGMAQRINALIDRSACARAARRADLGAALVLSKSEERGGGREKETILADACEAVIAALFLDGGLAPASAFIEQFWAEELDAAAEPPERDAKSALQEWAASKKKGLRYEIVDRSGPEHAPRFVIDAIIEGVKPARGEGGSKREAERAAAAALLRRVRAHG